MHAYRLGVLLYGMPDHAGHLYTTSKDWHLTKQAHSACKRVGGATASKYLCLNTSVLPLEGISHCPQGLNLMYTSTLNFYVTFQASNPWVLPAVCSSVHREDMGIGSLPRAMHTTLPPAKVQVTTLEDMGISARISLAYLSSRQVPLVYGDPALSSLSLVHGHTCAWSHCSVWQSSQRRALIQF